MINLCPHPPILSLHRPAILRSARKHSALNACIFDSFVCKKVDRKGDIDFLVDMEPGRSLLDLGGLLMDHQELLHRKVDFIKEKGLCERIHNSVLKEAIPL